MSEDGEYSLVMPFVVVNSVSGPFDDDAYAAGWEMGKLDERLSAAVHHALGCPTVVILRQNLPQAELVAMKHGMTMEEIKSVPAPDLSDEDFEAVITQWAHVRFSWCAPL